MAGPRTALGHRIALGLRLGFLGLLAVGTAYAFVEDPKEASQLREAETAQALPRAPLDLVLGEETGTDRRTHLEWTRTTAPERLTWERAKEYCETLTMLGGGFRLPSRDELLSILSTGEDPFAGEIDWFWSATPGVRERTAWAVGGGAWLNGNPTTTKSRVRCVRDAR